MAGFYSSITLRPTEGKQEVYTITFLIDKPIRIITTWNYKFLTFYNSLMNYSDEIRWSVDLRWQSPKHHWGFYDIGEGILFRSAGKQVEKPDWEKFFSVDRKEIWQKKYFKQVKNS